MAQGDKNISINQREILELCLPTEFSQTDDCMFMLDSDYPSESVDKESFETWKRRLQLCHVPPAKVNFGEHPWSKDHNWKHLLRVASDIGELLFLGCGALCLLCLTTTSHAITSSSSSRWLCIQVRALQIRISHGVYADTDIVRFQ
jgi:hypothetical protein